ncbi:MAG: hypothetical protein KatS3mg057_0185 [Herpetosiphonaceae bacterium]|nr:MAG: hypothetical protein KatS3mg057_0185 [Herpetosiphonaceae bacterium]
MMEHMLSTDLDTIPLFHGTAPAQLATLSADLHLKTFASGTNIMMAEMTRITVHDWEALAQRCR